MQDVVLSRLEVVDGGSEIDVRIARTLVREPELRREMAQGVNYWLSGSAIGSAMLSKESKSSKSSMAISAMATAWSATSSTAHVVMAMLAPFVSVAAARSVPAFVMAVQRVVGLGVLFIAS